MNLKRLALYNFRNFAQVEEIEFPENGLLVAAAPNATGKTNFLEAVVMLLRGRSFRASNEECVRWGEDSFILRGEVRLKNEEATIGVRYHQPSRKMRIEENGAPASLVTFFNHYPFVLFLPEDTFMFSRSPAQRRNFMNRVLISSPAYVAALVQYQRALKQRNSRLKQAAAIGDIRPWTELLVEHGLTLWQQRQALALWLETRLKTVYQDISGEEREFTVVLPSFVNGREEYMAALDKSFEYERRYGYTMYGPHRDDLEVKTNGRPLPAGLSQGQTRSAVLAMKLAAFRYIEQLAREQPLLLLDEALSELDQERQNELLKNLPPVQTLLTCTAVPEVLRDRPNVHLLDLRSIAADAAAAGKEIKNETAEMEPAVAKAS